MTINGYTLSPAIAVQDDAEKIKISSKGFVSLIIPGVSKRIQVGQILSFVFPKSSKLIKVAKGIYRQSGESGPPIVGIFGDQGFGTLIDSKR